MRKIDVWNEIIKEYEKHRLCLLDSCDYKYAVLKEIIRKNIKKTKGRVVPRYGKIKE